MNLIKKHITATAFILISAVSFCQDDVDLPVIETVPVYPGCEMFSDNPNLKNCMSKKVQQYVAENFQTNLASKLNLTGRQRISVQYKVDKNGYVVDVDARGPHPVLEREAKRVIRLLPTMKPGTQRGNTVEVAYSLPIIFEVEESKAEKKARKKLERKNKKANNK